MPDWNTIVLVTLAGLALSASPGPSMLYVLSRSIGQSRTAGFASAVGLALGGIFLALAAALGLTLVFTQSKTLYLAVQYIGATYLVYLGVQMFIPQGENGKVETVQHQSVAKIVLQGIFVELLNPKTILFFLAFLPQFIDVDKGSVPVQMLILGFLVPLTALPTDILVCFAGGALAQKISKSPRIGVLLPWLGGIFLIGLGIRTFFL